MSGFWAKVVTGGVPAPAPQQPQAPSSRPWWQESFYATPAPSTPQQVAQAPLQPDVYMPRQAVSTRVTETCPNCGCGNYFQPHATPNAMKQCYECGYNARFEQMASYGAAVPSDGAPAQPARQVSAAHQGYSGEVVAHI